MVNQNGRQYPKVLIENEIQGFFKEANKASNALTKAGLKVSNYNSLALPSFEQDFR
jgi:hypothetical protein